MVESPNRYGAGRVSGFFLIANCWLIVALVLMLGRVVLHGAPTMYSFLNIGGSFQFVTYYGLILLCLVAAGFCFRLHFSRDAR
jgi:hypothetical protein